MIPKTHLTRLFLTAILVLTATQAQAQVLSTDEQAQLAYMREEEKLARDVYQIFYERWQLPIFSNIAASEQKHMDAVLGLLNSFNLPDPASSMSPGMFSNPILQQLYDDLVLQGADSVLTALQASILIEETDIQDLDSALAGTSNSNISRVYNNLRKGSLNHLSAFSNNLTALGGIPQTSSSNDLAAGTAVYDPISQTLYIPAINVLNKSGETAVYDAVLKLVETIPQTLELVSTTVTGKLPNPVHAQYDGATGMVIIRDMIVGALNLDALNNQHYTATLQALPFTGSLHYFVVNDIQPHQGL